jgi:AsmA protein
MRHRWKAAGVAFGVALALSLGLKNWSIDPQHVRGDLGGALGSVEAPLSASLRLLPRPTLRLTNLRFHVAGGAVTAKAAAARATLSFSRLLAGEFSPISVTLRDADFRVDLDAAERAVAGLSRPPVAQLIVERGRVEVVSAQRGLATRADLSQARAVWASPEGPLSASASGRWRGQPAAASLYLGAPLLAAHGGTTPVSAALSATALAQFHLTGDWSTGKRAGGALYRGRMTALVPSLSRFADWVGLSPAPGPAPAGLELSARVSVDRSVAKLSDADIKLGGQPFEGDLDVMRTPAGLSISGTLAADALDLAALIGPPPRLFDAEGNWSTTPTLPEPNPSLDLDLRVSATRVAWGGHEIDNAAAAVSQRDGRLGVKLIDCGFAHGALSGETWIEGKPGAFASRLSLSLENADLGALAGEFGVPDLVGEGALKLTVNARGRSPAEIVASAEGEGSLQIADGVLRKLNFEEGLRRAQRRFIDVSRDMNAGDTRFGEARGRVEISDGEARFIGLETKAPGVLLSLGGAIDLKARDFRARLTARQSGADGTATPDGAHIDFALTGPWSGPALAPLLPPAD